MCGVEKGLYIETALTDMYAKSGDLRTAEGVFRSMSEKSVSVMEHHDFWT